MRAQVDFEPAYLLRQQPYRETSQLVEVFCATHGRVGLVARGVRDTRSRLRGVLQPFRPLLLSWRDRNELGTLTGAEPGGAPVALVGERVFHGWYLNELLLRLLQRRDPHAALYPLYAQTLQHLPGDRGEAALRRFEKRLLEAIGYGLQLPDTLDADTHYRYDPEHGPEPVHGHPRDSVPGAILIALRDECFDADDTRTEVRLLLRSAIDRQLGGCELQSRRLLQQLRRSVKRTS